MTDIETAARAAIIDRLGADVEPRRITDYVAGAWFGSAWQYSRLAAQQSESAGSGKTSAKLDAALTQAREALDAYDAALEAWHNAEPGDVALSASYKVRDAGNFAAHRSRELLAAIEEGTSDVR